MPKRGEIHIRAPFILPQPPSARSEGMTIKAVLYPTPAGIPASTRYAVTVDGQSSFTYQTVGPAEAEFTAGHAASWTSFDLRQPCEVRIRRRGKPIGQAVVRPLAARTAAEIDRGEVVLHLDRPCKLCVECDGDLTDVLFLFANEPETEIPAVADPKVVWFGPGVHEIGKFYPLQAGTTYYLAPGAFLKGSFAGRHIHTPAEMGLTTNTFVRNLRF